MHDHAGRAVRRRLAVQERIKCEIGQAFHAIQGRDGFPDLSRWAAGLTLTLQVDSTGNVAHSASLLGPFGSVTPLDISVGLAHNSKRTALLKIYTSFVEASRHPCPEPGLSPLQGSLGLTEWIVRVFESQRAVELRAEELRPPEDKLKPAVFESKEKAIGYSLDFALSLGAGITPTFVLSNASAKAGISGESKSTNSIDLALVELSEPDFRKEFYKVTIKAHKKTVVRRTRAGEVREEINVPEETVTRSRTVGGGVGPATKSRIDSVIQELQFRTLLPRR
jgi:hypothetical protein